MTSSQKNEQVNLLVKAFGGIHKLAEHNLCDQLIETQARLDLNEFQVCNKIRSHESLNVIIRKKQTKAELVKYLHGACYSPVSSTWSQAVHKKIFTTWPGLHGNTIKKHLPTVTATVQGHQKREHQGLQSTTRQVSTYKKRMEYLKVKYQELKARTKEGQSMEEV